MVETMKGADAAAAETMVAGAVAATVATKAVEITNAVGMTKGVRISHAGPKAKAMGTTLSSQWSTSKCRHLQQHSK